MRPRSITWAAIPVGALAAVWLAAPASAQLPARDQKQPALLDSTLLAWVEDRGAGDRIYARRLQPNGLPVGGPAGADWELTGVPKGAAKGDQAWPAFGGDLLVWSEKLPGGADYDLYAQRLFPNGRAKGAPVLVAGGAGDQLHATAAHTERGDVLVSWSEDTKDAGDVMGIRLTPALTPRGAAYPIAQGPGTAEDPCIVADASGGTGFLIVWTDDRQGNKDIYGSRLSAAGLPQSGPLGGQFPVVDSAQDDYGASVATYDSQGSSGPIRVSANPMLFWTRDDTAEGPNVMSQLLWENGLAVGRPRTLAGGPGVQAWPAAGGDLVAWADDGTGTLDVLGARMWPNGIASPRRLTLASD